MWLHWYVFGIWTLVRWDRGRSSTATPRYGGTNGTPTGRVWNKNSRCQSEREDETCLDNSGQKTLTECQSVVCRHSSNVTCQHLPLGTRRLNSQDYFLRTNFLVAFCTQRFWILHFHMHTISLFWEPFICCLGSSVSRERPFPINGLSTCKYITFGRLWVTGN